MAVNDNPSRKQYTQGPGGTTTDWPVDFKFSANEDLVVITTDPAGVDTTLTLDSDYSVTGAGSNDGGTVTIDPPATAGHRITIYREIGLDQPTVLPSSGGWFPKVHEAAFDRIVMQIQQLHDAVERSIKLSPTSTDSASDLSVLLESIDENAAAAEAARDAALGAQAATEATRDSVVADAEAAAAAVAGPYAEAASDSADAAAGYAAAAQDAAENITVKRTTPPIVASAGQTTFNAGFAFDNGAGNVIVYLSGLKQAVGSYTLSSPNVILSEACAGGELFEAYSISFEAAPGTPLYASNNLSDVGNLPTAQTNLGITALDTRLTAAEVTTSIVNHTIFGGM